MNTIENYYDDNILVENIYDDNLFDYDENFYEDDLLEDDLLEDDLLEDDLLEDDLLEDGFGEDFVERRRRGRKRRNRRGGLWAKRINRRHPRRTRKRSNFGKTIKGRASNSITKSEFKTSLDKVSQDVNAVKKSILVNNKALKALDDKYNDFVKKLARKDANHTKVLKNMQTTNMLSSMLNKPKFNESNLNVELELTKDETSGAITDVKTASISEAKDNNTVTFDQTMSMLLPMMTTMGDAKTGKSSGMEMLLPIMLLSQNKDGDSDSLTMPLLMMTMMNK